MNVIEKIRNKPHQEKIKLIWIIASICAILLIALWVATSKINRRLPKDMTLFQTLSRGIKDLGASLKK